MSEDVDFRASWVERFLGRELTDFQRRCVVLMCQARGCGPYDFTSTFKSAEWDERWVRFKLYAYGHGLATFDSGGLTALVIGAHDEAIRVEISPLNFRYLEITMHQRAREHGSIWGRHPTIERAIELHRPAVTNKIVDAPT